MTHLGLKQVLKHIIVFSALCNTQQQLLRDVQAPSSGASVSLFEEVLSSSKCLWPLQTWTQWPAWGQLYKQPCVHTVTYPSDAPLALSAGPPPPRDGLSPTAKMLAQFGYSCTCYYCPPLGTLPPLGTTWKGWQVVRSSLSRLPLRVCVFKAKCITSL